jgi:hypothetical protein
MSARPEMPPVLRPRDALLMLRGAGRILLAGSAAEPVSPPSSPNPICGRPRR